MKQIITRVDDDLADALRQHASRTGESVNSYVNRLLRVAVVGPGTPRHEWKVAAISNGRLMSRKNLTGRTRKQAKTPGSKIHTPSGYARSAVSDDRDDR
jgi:plasmid stability protein